MLVEHVFVTTYEEQEAMDRAAEFLNTLGFATTLGPGDDVCATRGRKTPNTRKVVQLPQTVQLTYDRGRVTVAAAIMARGGKDKAIHAQMMTELARALERLLVDREEPGRCAGDFRRLEARAGSIWSSGDRIALGLLVGFVLLIVIIVVVAVAVD